MATTIMSASILRRGLPTLAVAGSLLAFSCSSGLEGQDPRGTSGAPAVAKSSNGRFAFDPCVVLTDPITDVDVTGGVIPTMNGSERTVAFFCFATRSLIEDADDPVIDVNAAEDVFVAAVDARDIDPNAFTHAIAGKMRHPRCITCHQMNVDAGAALPPVAFMTERHFPDGGGLPPLNEFSDETCKGCHFEDWLSPGPTFDLRRSRARDLFLRAQVPPSGLEQHFKTDVRVLWALDDGLTPFGGAADDDHDGIDEPEDRDGVRRFIPGGKKAFLEQLDGWLSTRDPATNELKFSSADEAVHDIILASRAEPGLLAGSAASRAPSAIFEPNPAFDPTDPTAFPAGFLHIAFQSDAANFIGGNGAFTDIFKVIVDVLLTDEGEINLVYRPGSQVHVSRPFAGGDETGNSTDPDIGASGRRVAYVSEAFDIVPGPTVCRPEVYLFDEIAGNSLVSHVPGDPFGPGNQGSIRPDLSLDGAAVCFESDATDLVAGDTNGSRDVFFAIWPTLDVMRASVDDDENELPGHSTQGSIFHDSGNVKVAFACQETALPPVMGVQCPDVVVVLPAVRDTHLREGDANVNFGAADLHTGRTGVSGFGFTRSLVAFDLSSIPAGATINNVTLAMRVNMVPDGTSADCGANGIPNNASLHVLTADWVEAQATWNSRLTGTAWGTAGGDFIPGASATTQLTGTGTYMWSSAQMAADVQSWLDSGSNFGWLVDGTNVGCTIKRLDSREDPTVPSITIDFSPPAPIAAAAGTTGESSVFLRDTENGTTTDLNRIVTPDGEVAASERDVDGTELSANATNPVIDPYGNAVLFESMAQNLDVSRPNDENRVMDVVLVDLLQFESQGFILPYKLSVTSDGGDANGPSHSPRYGAFSPPTDAFPLGLAVYSTRATNLGNSDPGDLDQDGVPENDNFMLAYLSEGGSVLADFAANPARQGMNRAVQFENLSSGKPETFLWDFGDGTLASTLRSPSHVYSTPGFYSVSLMASGELGMDSRTKVDFIRVLGPVVATFKTTKDTSSAPDQAPAVDVDHPITVAGAIDDPDPASLLRFDMRSRNSEFPETFRWTLTPVDAGGSPTGASTTVATVADPMGVEIATRGFFELKLEATGPGGAGTAAQRIEVYQKVDAAFTTNPPGTPVRGAADLSVQFMDASAGDLLDQGAFLWDFGDGGTSTEENPTHTYAEGVYFASLTVFGKGTDESTSIDIPIIADGAITALFTVSPAGSQSGILMAEAIDAGGGVLVDFMNESQNQAADPLFFRWDFGTGAMTGQEMLEDPQGIQYDLTDPENSQTFFISLVTSKTDPAPVNCLGQPAGTCDEATGALIVYPEPMADFTNGPSFQGAPNRPPHTVNFTAMVTGDGTGTDPTYTWLRSEANSTLSPTIEFATGLTPQFEFPDPGTYKVVVRVETNGPANSRQVAFSPERDVVVTAASFSGWYLQAVAQGSGSLCTNCHAGANPPAELDLSGSFAEVVARLVNVPSTRCNTSRFRIEPGNPDDSVLYNVLLNPPGPLCTIDMRINLNGDEATKDGHVAVLRSWILNGAPND